MYGHLNACPAQKTGRQNDCTCESEGLRYLHLAGLSFLAFVVEVAVGVVTGSLALLSDAIHVFFDCTENVLSFAISRLSRRREYDENILRRRGGVISAFLLLGAAIWIINEALERLSEPKEVSGWLIAGAAVGLAINLCQWFVHQKAPDEHRNITHFWQDRHIRYDMFASVAVVLGGMLIIWKEWYAADTLISIAIGGWVMTQTARRLFGAENHTHHHH